VAESLSPSWPFPERHDFIGRHITLTPCDPKRDAAELFEAAHGSEAARALWEYMYVGPFESVAGLESWMAAGVGGQKEIPFTVRRRVDNRALGQIRLMEIETAHGRAELGSIWYVPAAQRTFANTEACFLLLSHLFDDLGYRRAEWKCDSGNEKSLAAARRLGFVYEGTFRQHAIRKGVNRDTTWFSIIDTEWPELRKRFEAFLSGQTAKL
jgi:RimJ/RimL family protein N-acetyltransferase